MSIQLRRAFTEVDNSLIASTEDRSDDLMSRVLVTFTNGHTLSIIRGEHTYGGSEGLFEVMGPQSVLFPDKEYHDGVIGHLDLAEVGAVMNKVANSLSSSYDAKYHADGLQGYL